MRSESYSLGVFDAIILADGDFPTHSIPLAELHKKAFLCCCDGAGKEWIERGGMPDAIVGDGDSLDDTFKKKYQDIIHIVEEQDDNDLTKATRFCKERGFKNILYLGTTGKREDHTIANLSLMVRYMQELNLSPTLMTDHGFFTPAMGSSTFKSFKHQQVSIFNFSCTQLEGEGLRWQPYSYQSWWQGTLNEALGESFQIKADGTYLVFQTYEAKK